VTSDYSASIRSDIFGSDRWAVVVHVVVGFNGRISGSGESVLTKDLAVRKIGISFDASLGSFVICVEEVKLIKILGSEFSSLDFKVTEESGSLVKGNNIR
jgi:hypothetical protein